MFFWKRRHIKAGIKDADFMFLFFKVLKTMNPTRKKHRVIFWGAWYGSKNVGDQALLLSISDLLGKAIAPVEFIVLTANPEHVHSYTRRDSIYPFTAIKMRTHFLDLIKAFVSADLFIFGGGVPFYDEVLHSVAMFLLVMLSKICRVPYLFWSVSSLPVKSFFTKSVLRFILPGSLMITCRDQHTARLLQECGVPNDKQRIIPDSAFTLQPGKMSDSLVILHRAGWKSGQLRPLVALTPRLLRGADGEAHTHYIPKSENENRKEMEVFAAVLDWLWENGYQSIFVPMNTVSPDSDLDAAREIVAISKYGQNALMICEEIFPRDAANIYSHCQAAFVARVHGSITAFLGGCPSLMYAFGLKHIGIMEQMNMTRYIFNPDLHAAQDAIALMSEMLESRTDLTVQLKKTHLTLLEQATIPLEAVFKIQ
jgi:polysaccharide pyruvyl transferase WcaK-like protein